MGLGPSEDKDVLVRGDHVTGRREVGTYKPQEGVVIVSGAGNGIQI